MVGAEPSTVMLVLTRQVGKVTIKRLIDVPKIIVNLVLGDTWEIDGFTNERDFQKHSIRS